MASITTDGGGGPKYGHLSKIDPSYAPLKENVDKTFAEIWELPMDEFRASWRAPPVLPEDIPVPGNQIEITHQKVPVRDGSEVELRVYKAKNPVKDAVLFLVAHGGGWVVGDHEIEEAQNRYVAARNKAVVVSVGYRMAPEFKFPYAVNDCFDALNWCKANASSLGINPERIIVGGGSAGGNIAAVLAQKARDQSIGGVIAQVLNIPVTCHPNHFPKERHEYTSFVQNSDASVLDAPKMNWFWKQYLPNGEPAVYASPLLAKSLKGLPPALVQIAGMDPLRDEGLAYAEDLKSAGVPVTLNVYPGLPHGFYMFPHLEPSVKYLQSVVAFIDEASQTGKN